MSKVFLCVPYLNANKNTVFKEDYFALHCSIYPMLNALGQTSYKHLQFFNSLLKEYGKGVE